MYHVSLGYLIGSVILLWYHFFIIRLHQYWVSWLPFDYYLSIHHFIDPLVDVKLLYPTYH